jgi:hypothetical protein
MAQGSHTGWFCIPKERRFCAHCGAKLTQKENLIMSSMQLKAWHPSCWDEERRQRREA